MTLDDLYDCKTTAELQERLDTLKLYELIDFLIVLEHSQEDRVDPEKKATLRKSIAEKVETKKKEQIQNFGKPLTRVLEDHLEQYDPRAPKNPKITDIHQKVLISGEEIGEECELSPMVAACRTGKVDVIHDLIALTGGLEEYLDHDEEAMFEDILDEDSYVVLECLVAALTEKTRERFLKKIFQEYIISSNLITYEPIHQLIFKTFTQYPIVTNIFEDICLDRFCKSQEGQDRFGYEYSGLQALQSFHPSLSRVPAFFSRFAFIIKNIQKEHLLRADQDTNIQENAIKLMSFCLKDLKSLLEYDRGRVCHGTTEDGQAYVYHFDQKKFNNIFALELQLIKKIYDAAPDSLQEAFNQRIRAELKGVQAKIPELDVSAIVLEKLSSDNPVEREALVFFLECEVFSEEDIKNIVKFYVATQNGTGVQLLQEYYPQLAHAVLTKIVEKQILDLQTASRVSTDTLYALRFIEDFSAVEHLVGSHLTQTQERVASLTVGYTIDDALFAHIHQDGALAGTYELQGHQPLATFKYLYHYLSHCIASIESKDESSPDFNKDELLQIQKKMLPAMVLCQKLHAISQEPRKSLENTGAFRVYEVTSLVIEKLLENEGELLIPGGWTGLAGAPGHAMLYEFKVMENGDWCFLVRNTGAGLLDYHQNIEKSKDVYYSSIKGFRLPFSFVDIQENRAQLRGFIRLLVEPQILPLFINQGYDQHRVYQVLIAEAFKLGFIEEDFRIFSQKITKGQRDGTCSYKVVTSSFLKTFPFADEFAYDKLHLGIKCYSIQDYYDRHQNRRRTAGVQHQLSVAIQNTTRLLFKHQALGILKDSQKLKVLGSFQQIESGLQFLRPKRKVDLTQYQPGLDRLVTQVLPLNHEEFSIQHPSVRLLPVKSLSLSTDKADATKKPVLEILIYSKDKALQDLNALLENCRYHYALGYEGLVILHIETFYFSIPLSENQYLELSETDQRATLAILAELNSLYVASVAMQNHKPFAKHMITVHRGIHLACGIMLHCFADSGLEETIYRMLGYRHLHTHTSFIEDHANPAPYFISCDPEKNHSFHAFNQFLRANRQAIENWSHKSFVHDLLAQESEIQSDFLVLNSQVQRNEPLRSELDQCKDLDKATYYFLENFQSLHSNPKYGEMMEKVKLFLLFQQLTHERSLFVTGAMDALFQVKLEQQIWAAFPVKDKFFIVSNPSDGYYCYARDIFPTNLYVSSQVHTIERTQPAIHDESIRTCLLAKRPENNNLLAQNEGETLSEKTCLLRTLSSIRLQPEIQVVATVDFMKRHFLRLNDTDIQNYIFANLYWFDLLQKQLQETPQIVSDIVDLIEKGFRVNIQGATLKEPLFFFMKVALCLRKILAILGQQNLENSLKLSLLLDSHLKNLVLQLQGKERTEYNIVQLQKIYAFFIWNTQLGIAKNRFAETKDVFTYLAALIFRRNYADPDLVDPYIEAEVNEAIAKMVPAIFKFISALEGHEEPAFSSQLTQLLISIVGPETFEKAQGEWRAHFPVLRYMSESNEELACVDLVKGAVYTEGKSYVPLPASVYNHPLFTFFFSVKSIPSIASFDRNTYEFSYEGQWYRFHRVAGADLSKTDAILQQKMSRREGDTAAWYEYIPKIGIALPLTLCHFGIHAWARVDASPPESQDVFIQDSVSQKILGFIDIGTQRIGRDTEHGLQYLLNIKTEDYFKHLPFVAHFEDPQFIECWVSEHRQSLEKPRHLLIRLPRYDLEFQETVIDSEKCYIFSKDQRYKIDLNSREQVIPGLLAPIVLVPLAEYQADRLRTLVLIPKQEFYCIEKVSDNEYYSYQFDTRNKVPSRRLQIAGLLSTIEAQDPKLFYYSRQESYVIYTLSEDGVLLSEDCTAQIYSAYLYLAKRLPQLAYETLKGLSDRPLFLSAEQVECLRRIIKDLPASIAAYPGEHMVQNKAFIKSPEFAAVRMLAAAMIEKQKLQAQVVSFVGAIEETLWQYMSQHLHLKLGNRHYQRLVFGKTEGFYHNINYLHDVVQSYRNLYNNIPANMILQHDSERSLLAVFVRAAKQKGCMLYFVSSKSVLPENLEFIREKLPLLIVDEDKNLAPIAIIIVDKFQKIQKIESMPAEFPRELLQTFTHQFYGNEQGFLEKKHPLFAWLITKMGHTLAQDNMRTHILYRYRQLKEQQLALQRSRNMEIKAKDHRLYEYTNTLVENKVQFKFDTWGFVLPKFYQGILQGPLLGIAVSSWDPSKHLSHLMASFFSFAQIAADPADQKHSALRLKIEGHLRYLAWAQVLPQFFDTKDHLVAILAFILKYPEILRDQIKHLANHGKPRQAFETLSEEISKLSEEHRLLEASYRSLSRQQSDVVLELQSLPSLEVPLDGPQSIGLPQNFHWDFMTPYQAAFQTEVVRVQTDGGKEQTFFRSAHSEENLLATQFWTELEQDYRAGVEENYQLAVRNEAALSYYREDSGHRLIELHTVLKEKLCLEEENLRLLAATIVDFANQTPLDESRTTDYQLGVLALRRFSLDLQDILYLYLCQNKSLFNQYTVLDDEQIQRLNAQVLEYLSRFTELQHYQRFEIELQRAIEPKLTEELRADRLKKVGELIDLKRSFIPEEEPLFLLFEYYQNKRIFPKQHRYLKSLSQKGPQGFISQSAQLIMGGGKTSLIIPILALKMATGTTLSVVEVPSALFQVNLNDLHETTFGLWKKSAHPFIFDDSVNCTVEYLRDFRNRLRLIILNREYLVTTRESMQSLELKYIRLLRFSRDDETNNKRLQLFNEIICIFRESNAIMDEVDLTLSVKKQLIQVVGKGDPVPDHEIKIILELFGFIQNIDVTAIVRIHGASEAQPMDSEPDVILIKDILREKATPSNEHWPNLMIFLVSQLFSEPQSPLFHIVQNLRLTDLDCVELLKNYILGKSLEYPDFIHDFEPIDQDRIVLYKELFAAKLDSANLLTLCFQKSVDEEIGLSRDAEKMGFERELSIPYIANNVPNETARHGHYLETMLYTIKIQQMKSLSESVVLTMIQSYTARLEKTMGPDGGPVAYDAVRAEFKTLTGQDLVAIEIHDQTAFQEFHRRVKDQDQVKIYCLRYHILNHIDKNGFTTRSNAQNHASQFRSVQGVTGTNWTYRCHPHGMHPDVTAGLGIDGQTIDFLRRHAEKPLLLRKTAHSVFESMTTMLVEMPKKAALNLQAWIDLGAYFKGVSNEQIADHFLGYFTSDAFKAVTQREYRYVLFFDQYNKFWALNLRNRDLIHLKSTDYEYTKRTLGCKPEEWFTYYDQIHTTGTDILQGPHGYALVTLGLKTIERDVLQAVMRMRQLRYNQRIIFVVPKEIQEAYPQIKTTDWNVQAILNICIENQIKRLCADHYSSAIQKLRNELRNDFLVRILKNPSIALRREWCKIFEDLFFSKVERSAFQQFKHITTLEETSIVLAKMIRDLLDQRSVLMRAAGIQLAATETSQFEERLRSIMDEMLPFCLRQVMQPDNSDGLAETEVNFEKDQDTEKDQEIECDIALHSKTKAQPLRAKRWGFVDFKNWNIEAAVIQHFIHIEPLEYMVQTHPLVSSEGDRRWTFSLDIWVTENFRDTCENQPQKLDVYKKESLLILMIQDQREKTLRCLMITPEEAVYFRALVLNPDKHASRFAWIESIHQTVWCGEKPQAALLHGNYNTLVEQLALFNGDMDVLLQALNRDSRSAWFLEMWGSKMHFLERCILPLHQDKPNLSRILKQKIAVIELNVVSTDPLVFSGTADRQEARPALLEQPVHQRFAFLS